ncbi:hypothetical protein SLS60_011162 [Paraconiothyrium brasiliense]|uniref:Uncharacterized protein n=1 Tax=Paraconiothyrium brasiliense TaxID=300254 RepID=A0ABR3QKR9_9PLEO
MFLCDHGVCGILRDRKDVLVCTNSSFYSSCIEAYRIRYMFLLEREHVVRAPFIRKRTEDWIWVGGTSFVLVAFGAIAIWSLITPHAELSAEDGQCRIGLATVPAYLLLIFDALINASLTIVFVVLLQPVLKFRERTSPYYDDGSTLPSVSRLRRLVRQLGSLGFKEEEIRDNFSINIKKVLWKNVIGSSISFLASGANLAIFLSEKGNQLAIDDVVLQEALRLNDDHGDLSSSDKPTHRHKHDSSGLLMERKLHTLLSIHSLADKYEIEGLQASLSQYMPGQRELCAAWLSRYSSHLQKFVREHYRACIDKDCMMGRRVCSMVLHFGSKRFVKDPVFDDLTAQYPKFCTDMFREACDDDRILFGTRENLNMPVNSTSMLVHEKD